MTIPLVFFSSQEDFQKADFLWLLPQALLRYLSAAASAISCMHHRHLASGRGVQGSVLRVPIF